MRNFFTPLAILAAAAVLRAQTPGALPAPGTNGHPVAANTPQTPAPGPAAKPAAAKAAASNAYHVPEFSTYQPIIDRMPFGKPAPPPPQQPDPPPVDNTPGEQEMQALARMIRLQAIVRNPDGRTAAGFSDRTASPERLIYLAVGDTQDGFHLVAADYNKDTATIEKDGVTITIKLGAGMIPTVVNAPALNVPAATPQVGGRVIRGANNNAPAPPMPPMPPMPPAATSRFNPETPETWPIPSENLTAIDLMLKEGVDNKTYRERLEQRRNELIAKRAQEEADNAKAIDAAVEERTAELFITMMRRANLDNIRDGGEGLGIPLTPEEDAMLTREGVLPGADDDDDE